MDEQTIRAAIDDMAAAIFRSIDPAASYLVIEQGKAGPFITQRLTSGLPVNLVGHRDSPTGHPIRDLAIYKVSEAGEAHNEIAQGWAPFLVDHEIARLYVGADLTVEAIRACATMQAIAFIDATGDSDE